MTALVSLVLSLGQQSVLHAILTFDMRVVTMRSVQPGAEKRDIVMSNANVHFI